jgi:hypothetical protein
MNVTAIYFTTAERHWTQRTWIPARTSWRETSTNRRTARVKKASTGFYSGPANYCEQHHTSHEQDLHERLPLLYKYVSHAISPYLRKPQGYVYRDACCRSTTIAIARR